MLLSPFSLYRKDSHMQKLFFLNIENKYCDKNKTNTIFLQNGTKDEKGHYKNKLKYDFSKLRNRVSYSFPNDQRGQNEGVCL